MNRWCILLAIVVLSSLVLAACVSKKSFRSELEDADARLEQAHATTETLERELQAKSEQLKQASGQVAELDRKIAALKEVSQSASHEASAAQAQAEVALTDLKETKENAAKLEAEISQKKQQLEDERRKYRDLKSTIDTAAVPGETESTPDLTAADMLIFLKQVAWAAVRYGVWIPESNQLKIPPPKEMNIDDSFIFKLVIQPEADTAKIEVVEKGFQSKYGKEFDLQRISATPKMSAYLWGNGFVVTVLPREAPVGDYVIRDVKLNEATIWEWLVEPREVSQSKAGHTLHLSLLAHTEEGNIPVLGEKPHLWNIVVTETAGQMLAGFTGRHWQWIWAAFIVPIVGWSIQLRKSRGKA